MVADKDEEASVILPQLKWKCHVTKKSTAVVKLFNEEYYSFSSLEIQLTYSTVWVLNVKHNDLAYVLETLSWKWKKLIWSK